jgi:peptidoglycan/LPS O-acetylase OafA/YrhL
MGPGRGRWPALDGLRAVAVLLVMAGHYGHVVPMSSLGVEIFYVLSGFLITSLLLDEHEITGAISIPAFYLRRSFRIFPAFYVSLAVTAFTLAGTAAMPGRDLWIAAGVYTADYAIALHPVPGSALTHTWSLAVEEQFYLIWPLALGLLLRGGARRTRLALVGVIAAVTVWRAWLEGAARVAPNYLFFAFDTRADFLAAGALLAVAWRAPEARAWYGRLAGRRWLPLIPIAALGLIAATLDRSHAYALSFPLKAVLTACLIAQLLCLAGDRLWAVLERPAVRWAGTLSYSLYLYHYLAWLVAGGIAEDPLARGMLALGLSVGVAAASYYAVERPMLGLRDRICPAAGSRGRAQLGSTPLEAAGRA